MIVKKINYIFEKKKFNKIEISKIFWQAGEHQIGTALLGSFLLRQIASKIEDNQLLLSNAE
jgi:hypothetical protein